MSKAPDWAKLMGGTIKKYVEQSTEATMRNAKLLALLEKEGRVNYNSGDQVEVLAEILEKKGQHDLAALVRLQDDVNVSLSAPWATDEMRMAVGYSWNVFGRKP